MAIKPVEYVNDSSTPGFAKAGDEKTITKTNANTIRKDADQGNTKDLTPDQETYLEGNVDYDTLDYSNEEMEKVGEKQIDTKNTKNTNGWQTAGAMIGGGGGSIVSGGVTSYGGVNAVDGSTKLGGIGDVKSTKAPATTKTPATETPSTPSTETPSGSGDAPSSGGDAQSGGGDSVGSDAQKNGQTTDDTAKIPWMALVAGAISLAGGAAALIGVEAFDNQYKDRMNYKNSSSTINSTIQSYADGLVVDMEAMVEDSKNYEELSATLTESQVATITEVGALQAEMLVYQSQGNTAKVAELKAKIEALQKTSEEDNKGPQEEMSGLKENIETYTGNNAEASGVKASGDNVAEFLGDGRQMGILGYVQAGLLTIGALLMLKGTISAATAAAKMPWPVNIAAAVVAIAGAAMMVAGNVMTAMAALKMFGKAKDEMACADAGNEMTGYLATLQEGIDAQANYTESTSGGYAETDEAATETVAENQEAANEANGQGTQGGQGAQGGANPTTKPPKTTEPPADVAA